jgi:hypothetical protein
LHRIVVRGGGKIWWVKVQQLKLLVDGEVRPNLAEVKAMFGPVRPSVGDRRGSIQFYTGDVPLWMARAKRRRCSNTRAAYRYVFGHRHGGVKYRHAAPKVPVAGWANKY